MHTTAPAAAAAGGPMKSRAAAVIVVSAIGFFLLLLMFGGNAINNNNNPATMMANSMSGGRGGAPCNSVFHQCALSRSLDYPAPEEIYFVPPSGDFTPTERFPKKLKVLITGGAGFIGSQLGYKLHLLGHEVTLLDNMMFGYWDNLVVDGAKFGRLVRADVLDPRIVKFFEGVDVVFHFAALSALPVCQSHPRDAMSINVGGVANVLECSRQAGVGRFVFASTSAVYEDNTEAVLDEDLKVNPHLLYSLSKYQAELLVKGMSYTNNVDFVILRFFNVYGPHQDFRRKSPPFTSYLIRELSNSRVPKLHSDGKQKRDYVHVDDLMRLATLCMTHPSAKGEIFNVASGDPISVNDIYHIVAKALNSTIKPEYRDPKRFWDAYPQLFEGKKPISEAILVKEVVKRTVGTYEKAQRLLGWKPQVTMKQGLEDMVKYVIQSQRMASQKGSTEKTAW